MDVCSLPVQTKGRFCGIPTPGSAPGRQFQAATVCTRPTAGVSILTDFGTVVLADAAAVRRYNQALGTHNDFVSALALSPDGRHVATASGDEVFLWEIDPEAWRRKSCETANRALSQEEWSRFLGALPYAPACGAASDEVPVPADAFSAFVLARAACSPRPADAALRMFARAAELVLAEKDAKLSNESAGRGPLTGQGERCCRRVNARSNSNQIMWAIATAGVLRSQLRDGIRKPSAILRPTSRRPGRGSQDRATAAVDSRAAGGQEHLR